MSNTAVATTSTLQTSMISILASGTVSNTNSFTVSTSILQSSSTVFQQPSSATLTIPMSATNSTATPTTSSTIVTVTPPPTASSSAAAPISGTTTSSTTTSSTTPSSATTISSATTTLSTVSLSGTQPGPTISSSTSTSYLSFAALSANSSAFVTSLLTSTTTLAVKSSVSQWELVAIILGTVFAVILITLIIWFCCYACRNTNHQPLIFRNNQEGVGPPPRSDFISQYPQAIRSATVTTNTLQAGDTLSGNVGQRTTNGRRTGNAWRAIGSYGNDRAGVATVVISSSNVGRSPENILSPYKTNVRVG